MIWVLAEELVKLDACEAKVLEVLAGEHPSVSGGRVAMRDGRPLRDDGPIMHAVAELNRITDLRARLVGCTSRPAPGAVITEDMVDAQIAALEEEIAARARLSGAAPREHEADAQ